MVFDTKTAVKTLAIKPMVNVTANPRTGPSPKRKRKAQDTTVVTCVSTMVHHALRKPLSTAEITLLPQYGKAGSKFEVLVQLPGVDDPARAKELIGTAAVLEICDVKEGPFPSKEGALAQKGGILPMGTKLVRSKPRGTQDGEQWYLVAKTPVITGREMRNARAGQDEFRKWETNFSLSQDGGRRFGRYTEANIGNKLAVVLDSQIVSVATIQSKIEDSGRITGLGSEEESVDLGRYLRSGSLPAGVQYNEERSIGPSLGADSIHAGLMAGLAGLIAVIAVMLVYYKRSGVNAAVSSTHLRAPRDRTRSSM